MSPLRSSIWRDRLGRRLVILLLAMNAFLSIFATGFQLYASFDRQYDDLIGVAERIENGFGQSLAGALWAFDFSQVDLILDGVFANAEVAALSLTSDAGRSWSRGDDTPADPEYRQAIELEFTGAGDEPVRVGALMITLDRSLIWDELYAQVVAVFFTNLAKTSLASIVMLVFFGSLVSRHLHRIAAHVAETDWLEDGAPLVLDRTTGGGGDDLEAVRVALNEAKARVVEGVAEREAVARRLRMVLDTSSSGVVGLEEGRRVVIINAAARHMLGGLVEDTPFDWPEDIEFLSSADMKPLGVEADPIHRSVNGDQILAETKLMTRRGGGHRYIRIASTPTNDPAQPIRTVIVIDDISDQEMNRQKIERAGRLDALGQLTGGIAHDFNNLLSTVIYALELAKVSPSPERERTYLDTALGAATRGSNLTNRLLSFAKSQPGLEKSHDIGKLFEDLRVLARPTIEAQIDLSFELEDEDLHAFCDGSQLESAILNLIINARDAIIGSGRGDRIVITGRGVRDAHDAPGVVVEDDDGEAEFVADGLRRERSDGAARADGKTYRYAEITVADNGPGMSEAVKGRAVDPFFTTKGVNAGTGLGLSTVYGFIRQAGGELRIVSEEGHGASIRMTLPRGVAGGVREEPMEPQFVHRPSGETLVMTKERKARILIVEDEAALLEMMEDLLTSLGFEIMNAANGVEALELAEADADFDLLLTDIVMPGGVGGFELARRLRAKRPDLAIVYMSGYTGYAASDMEGVVAPLVRKPCPAQELLNAINLALSERA